MGRRTAILLMGDLVENWGQTGVLMIMTNNYIPKHTQTMSKVRVSLRSGVGLSPLDMHG